jgi:hypothetical protein
MRTVSIGSVRLLPRFWLFIPSSIAGLLLLYAAGLTNSYVEIPNEPPRLVREEGERVFKQTVIVNSEYFAHRPIFNTASALFLIGAGVSLVTGSQTVVQGKPTPKPEAIDAPAKKPLATKTPLPPPSPSPIAPPQEPVTVSDWLEPLTPAPSPPPIAQSPEPKPVTDINPEPEEDGDDLWADLIEEVDASPIVFGGFTLPPEDPDEWIDRFIRQRQLRIAGNPGSGKSFFSTKLLIADLKAGANIAVCDTNFGKPRRTKNGSILLDDRGQAILTDWNGFSPESIFNEKTEIARVVREFHEEMANRKRLCTEAARTETRLKPFQPWMLYFDEIDATLSGFKATGYASVLDHLSDLISEGDGYGVGVRLIGQSLAVGRSQINEALNGQLSVLILGGTALNAGEVSKLKISRGQVDELIAQVTALNESGKFGAIVQFSSGEVQAVAVPDLSDLDQYRFSKESAKCLTTTPILADDPLLAAQEEVAV